MRGNPDAVASAYSLDDYRIADDLGGEARLREPARPGLGARHPAGERHGAQPHGHRFALGHRAPRVVPVARPSRPIPAYTFSGAGPVARRARRDRPRGPLLGRQRRRGRLQAVRPRDRRRRATSTTATTARASPGTTRRSSTSSRPRSASRSSGRSSTSRGASRSSASTPRWSSPRSTSSGCGGRSPGAGGGIPSRAEHAMPQAEFDARMPVEFWREVVDRVAAEVPDTLLLAEAFWLLEGYFVRTLGMHRVYNSAFMHMLRDEDGAGYRKVIKRDARVRPRDPQALRQLHEQPRREDRARAVRQGRQVLRRRDGDGDAARACRCSATARSRASARSTAWSSGARRSTSSPTPGCSSATSARSSRCSIGGRGSPRRTTSCCTTSHTDGGGVDEDVFAYSNGLGPTRSLVVYHDRFASTGGRIRESAAYASKAAERRASGWSGGPSPRASGCPTTRRCSSTFRDARTGSGVPALVPRRSAERGLWLALDAYQGHVFWEFREIHDGVGRPVATPGASGSAERGVPSLDDALRELQLEPVHAPLRAVFDDGLVAAVLDGTADRADLDELEERFAALPRGDRRGDRRRRAIRSGRGTDPRRGDGRRISDAADAPRPRRIARRCSAGWRCRGSASWRRAPTSAATSRAWYDELRLAGRRRGLPHGRASTRPRHGRSPTRSACCSALPTPVDDPRARPRTATCACSSAGWPTTPSGRRWASTPGKASSGSIATGSSDLLRMGRPARRDRDWPVTRSGGRGSARRRRRERRLPDRCAPRLARTVAATGVSAAVRPRRPADDRLVTLGSASPEWDDAERRDVAQHSGLVPRAR